MKTELVRCHYCLLSWEGFQTDTCPKCHEHFIEVLARYPSLEERDEEKLNEEFTHATG